MEFPLDVWLLIRQYQIPNKSYWKKKFSSCINQLTGDQLGVGLENGYQYKTRIHNIGIISRNNFTYKHNMIYYPYESNKNHIEARRIVYILHN